jgi:hypothetical protein
VNAVAAALVARNRRRVGVMMRLAMIASVLEFGTGTMSAGADSAPTFA